MKKILFSLIVLAFAGNVSAQTDANVKKPSLALKVSAFDFTTARAIQVNTLGAVLSNKSWEKLSNSTKSIGVQYFKGITSKMDFMVNLDLASLSYPYYASSGIKTTWGSASGATSKGFYAAADAGLNFKILTDDHKVVPYLSAGIGISKFASNYMAYAPVGAGIQIKANHGSFINILSTFRAEMSSLTKTHFNHGVSYSMPLKLKEKKPVVLPPPPPPADTDNDGVIDANDKCPTVAGLAKYAGCPIPDTDKDGVNDEQDKCPTVAGLAKYAGCPIPDTDKDGINDEQDKCPTVAGLSRYNGCPIPDTDKDGINDEVDACPTEAGISANHGCPDVQPILTQAASNLKFATGKSYLSVKQLANLDAVVAVLAKYTNVSVAIGGHTDNTGAERLNSKLSINRASVVAKYLIKKGVDAKRITSSGFGYANPAADNKTKEGRAQNRRDELTAVYN
ncbi:MAG: OmpA family protein [Bacteroidetes bacterium]|nr:OmpA family protein [Bacteroidota bacterium]